MAERALTLNQELFIRHFIRVHNATEAARLAGYKGDDHTLQVRGSELLKHPIIAARISEFVTDVGVSAQDVLSELAEVAFSPWKEHVVEIVDKNGNIVGARIDLKDKVRALELLGKYHKLFTDNVTVGGPVMKAIIGIDLDDV